MLSGRDHTKWHNILWREWRNCQNSVYAEQLFELVADTPVGWGTRLTFMLLDMVIGLIAGLLFGFVFTLEWAILGQLMLAGAVVGAVRGFLAAQRLHWRDWLARLSLGLPTKEPGSGLLLIFLFLLFTSLVFGPLLWLGLIGLFWGMSGLIQWMNKDAIPAHIFAYHPWYFWWRIRPRLKEVEAALDWAATIEPDQPQPDLIPYPAANAPEPPKIDFSELKVQAQTQQRSPEP